MSPRTIASTFGENTADDLARWAIDLLVYPPETIATYSTRVRAREIERGRTILERAGIDWRMLKQKQEERRR